MSSIPVGEPGPVSMNQTMADDGADDDESECPVLYYDSGQTYDSGAVYL